MVYVNDEKLDALSECKCPTEGASQHPVFVSTTNASQHPVFVSTTNPLKAPLSTLYLLVQQRIVPMILFMRHRSGLYNFVTVTKNFLHACVIALVGLLARKLSELSSGNGFDLFALSDLEIQDGRPQIDRCLARPEGCLCTKFGIASSQTFRVIVRKRF